MNRPKIDRMMDTQTILILIAIGIVAGILSGLVGIGGGIVIVPALVYILGFNQFKAQGTTLGLLLLPVGILAVYQFYKQGHIDMKVVGIIACGFVLGSFLGGKFALSLPQDTIKKIFAAVIIIIGVKMLLDKKKVPAENEALPHTELHKNR